VFKPFWTQEVTAWITTVQIERRTPLEHDVSDTEISDVRGGLFFSIFITKTLKKLNTVAVVRKRTISTVRPPLVGEVSANLCG
jgi:hypothetical protein